MRCGTPSMLTGQAAGPTWTADRPSATTVLPQSLSTVCLAMHPVMRAGCLPRPHCFLHGRAQRGGRSNHRFPWPPGAALARDSSWAACSAPLRQPASALCTLPNPISQPSIVPTPQPSLQAVKAMRYGEGGGAVQEFEDATALREKQEQELAAALEEDDDF